MKNIVIIGTLPSYMVNFRGDLIKLLSDNKNNHVTAMISENASSITTELQQQGVALICYPIKRNGLNPLADFSTWLSLRNTFKKIRPQVILAYTIKPVIWGGIASRITPQSRFYALITGLGFAFQGDNLRRQLLGRIVTLLYRTALKRADRVIFQNPDNLNEFVSRNIISADRCALVNGSGVDLGRYVHTPLPTGNPTFLSIGRLLGEKGFREYSQAAKIVKTKYPDTIFQLLGPEDPSPDGISLSEVHQWQQQGWLEYLGSTDDVRPYLQNCQIYVLPSYHEGMPRTVLEAMAIGRPILTTDVPGCRETVTPGENGHLVPKADVHALVEKMIWFLENRKLWEHMGNRSRELAEEYYDVHKINAQLMEIMGLGQKQ